MEVTGLVVKNTFLSFPAQGSASGKRSSSAPRAWKPSCRGDARVNVSAGDWFQECWSERDNEIFEDCFSDKGDVASEERSSDRGADELCEKCVSVKTGLSSDTTDESLADASEEWPSDNWSFANTEDSFSIDDMDGAFEESTSEGQHVMKDSFSIDDYEGAFEESTGEGQHVMMDGCSIADYDYFANENSSVDSMQDAGDAGKVTLNLFDTVCPEHPVQAEGSCRSRLRSNATPFASVTCPPDEVTSMIAGAVQVLRSSLEVMEVKVRDGGMGGTTLIIAHSRNSSPDGGFVFSEMQDALLSMAEQSENTYILGYNATPFQTLDALSFSTTIAVVPEAHQETACWDYYEKGCCHRCGSCRWDHPANTDMMKLIVTMTKNVAD